MVYKKMTIPSSRITKIGGDILTLKALSHVKWSHLLASRTKLIYCGLSPFYKTGAMFNIVRLSTTLFTPAEIGTHYPPDTTATEVGAKARRNTKTCELQCLPPPRQVPSNLGAGLSKICNTYVDIFQAYQQFNTRLMFYDV